MGDAINPYSAPQADGETGPANVYNDGLVDAKPSLRFANLIIDYVLYLLLCFAIGALAMVVGYPQLAGVLTWPALLGYYVFFEGIFNATPGKMITRTRVVQIDGTKPTIGQVFGRTLSRFVPFEAFSFLGSGSGWHDRWSRTRVVRVP